MAPRRAGFVLFLLFGFRLVAVGGAVVCTAHGSHSHVAEAGHHPQGSPHDRDNQPTPCHSPGGLDCCAAMAACSSALAVPVIVAVHAPAPDQGTPIGSLGGALLSRPHSPDPPPPKS